MIVIRKTTLRDIPLLADIWLRVSLEAHDFIFRDYWISNKPLMEEQYLPGSEVYVADQDGVVLGFIALVENHIASIFVDTLHQGRGIGRLLLDYAKGLRPELTLSVYQKNEKSVRFYQSNHFCILSEAVDAPTQEKEYYMQWVK